MKIPSFLMLISILSLCLLLHGVNMHAHAQSTGEAELLGYTSRPTPSTAPHTAPQADKKKTGFEDIPYEYIVEANDFGEACRNGNKTSLYFDCRCMEVEYLNIRIDKGPEVSPSEINALLGDSCKDATGIAGKIYGDCKLDIVNAPKHLDPEEFCSCYGNTFAKYFESLDKRMTAKNEIVILTMARTRCSDPATARRLYGPETVQ